jgi:hypothetical protein
MAMEAETSRKKGKGKGREAARDEISVGGLGQEAEYAEY